MPKEKIMTDVEIEADVKKNMTPKEKAILKDLEKEDHSAGKFVNYKPFFQSMFKTFGISLLIFMGLLLMMFIMMWLR